MKSTNPLDDQQESSSSNASDQHKQTSSKLIEREKIPNTPFEIITTDTGHFLAYNVIRLTENMKRKEDVQHYLIQNNWEIISYLISGMIELNNQFKEKNIKPMSIAEAHDKYGHTITNP